MIRWLRSLAKKVRAWWKPDNPGSETPAHFTIRSIRWEAPGENYPIPHDLRLEEQGIEVPLCAGAGMIKGEELRSSLPKLPTDLPDISKRRVKLVGKPMKKKRGRPSTRAKRNG